MLQRGGAKLGVHHRARLVVQLGDPQGELRRVGDGGGEKDEFDCIGQKDDGFLPDYTTV